MDVENDEEAITALVNICGIPRPLAEDYLEATGNVLSDACFLHYSVSGIEPQLYPVFFGKELRISPDFRVEMGPPKPVEAVSPKELTEWEEVKYVELREIAEGERKSGHLKADENEQCAVCMCEFGLEDDTEIVRLGKCKSHFFHKECITNAIGSPPSLKCPVCGQTYGTLTGSMPPGIMTVFLDPNTNCSGFSVGTWAIDYHIPDGVSSGKPYHGTGREAYLPNNAEGREVLRLLVCAFYRRQTFAVGTSVTTGRDNSVVWSGIHHKTSLDGGPTNFGYPDPTYFSRVKGELATRGVLYS